MESSRFLFVSAAAALVTDLAWQGHREGHDVKHYIEAEADREIGDGTDRPEFERASRFGLGG